MKKTLIFNKKKKNIFDINEMCIYKTKNQKKNEINEDWIKWREKNKLGKRFVPKIQTNRYI